MMNIEKVKVNHFSNIEIINVVIPKWPSGITFYKEIDANLRKLLYCRKYEKNGHE